MRPDFGFGGRRGFKRPRLLRRVLLRLLRCRSESLHQDTLMFRRLISQQPLLCLLFLGQCLAVC